MSPDCLPFSEVPHTSRLYSDYLSHFEGVQRFFAREPLQRGWYRDQAASLPYDPQRRERVAAVLERQNRAWGCSETTFDSLRRFRAGAAVAVTGQQVTLFGGPLFAVYKALTAIKVAEQASKSGIDTVPVFWLATEDHDLAEVSRATLLRDDGSLHALASASSGPVNAPVGSIRFGDEVSGLVAQARELLGSNDVTEALARAYRPGAGFGEAFARFFAEIFRERSMVLLDPSDPELHELAAPVYRAAIMGAPDLDGALLERGRELETAGYHQQVKVTPSSTLLFTLQDESRIPIHRVNGEFEIAGHKLPQEELLARIQAEPRKFSANVLLRPVVQDYLLPTLAYIGGPAEVAYFAQAEVVYRELLGRVTPVVPRMHAFILEPRIERLLARYSISLPDTFHGAEHLREKLAMHVVPGELQSRFARLQQATGQELDEILAELEKIDRTAADAARKRAAKIRYQVERIQQKAARSGTRRCEEIDRHAALLGNALYPHKNLQEREIAAVSLLARHGEALLDLLYEVAGEDCPDYHLLRL